MQEAVTIRTNPETGNEETMIDQDLSKALLVDGGGGGGVAIYSVDEEYDSEEDELYLIMLLIACFLSSYKRLTSRIGMEYTVIGLD